MKKTLNNTIQNFIQKDMTSKIAPILFGMAIVLVVVLIAPDMIFAQPPLPSGDISQAPIDGGLSLVAAAGGAYAWRKLRQNRKG